MRLGNVDSFPPPITSVANVLTATPYLFNISLNIAVVYVSGMLIASYLNPALFFARGLSSALWELLWAPSRCYPEAMGVFMPSGQPSVFGKLDLINSETTSLSSK